MPKVFAAFTGFWPTVGGRRPRCPCAVRAIPHYRITSRLIRVALIPDRSIRDALWKVTNSRVGAIIALIYTRATPPSPSPVRIVLERTKVASCAGWLGGLGMMTVVPLLCPDVSGQQGPICVAVPARIGLYCAAPLRGGAAWHPY